jgi:hypothetical protein
MGKCGGEDVQNETGGRKAAQLLTPRGEEFAKA